MYMCSWWFSWRAANSQRARRRKMGRGRVQGAPGRGIVGTHPVVAWPTMRYFLPSVLERIRWLIRERFSTKSGVLILNKDISFLYQNKKNGLLIRIIHNGLEDSLDHIQIRILWIHDHKRFFTSMDPKWVNIARLAAVTRNIFNTYISCLTTPLIFTAILYPRRGLSDRLGPFYQDGKIVIQTGPALL